MGNGSRTVLAPVLAALALVGSLAGDRLERFDRHGIAFEYPRGWFVTTKPLSNGLNPAYRFAVSSSPVQRTKADAGPCLPGVARQLDRGAVFAYLREALGSDRRLSLPRVSPRPRSFRLPRRTDTSLCGFGRGGRWIAFKQAGRVFYLGVYVGPKASASARRALARALNGMDVAPR
jgi:hypothetical protein